MSDQVVQHPYHDLMAEAVREREVVDSAEARALQRAIFDAVFAYSDFLDRRGLIWDHSDPNDLPRMKARALVITCDYGEGCGSVDISLKAGACDRVYGNGVNPDPEGRGPLAIPHKHRP